MAYPVLSLVALYILTGSDYLSSFYMCTKTKFLDSLIQNLSFICPNGSLLKMIGSEFQYINEDAWVRLISAVYYTKHKAFFRSKPITHTYDVIHNHPDSPESQHMLSALNFTSSSRSQLLTWHEFIRRVTYHIPEVTKLTSAPVPVPIVSWTVWVAYKGWQCRNNLGQWPFMCWRNLRLWEWLGLSWWDRWRATRFSDSEQESMPVVASDSLSDDDYEA